MSSKFAPPEQDGDSRVKFAEMVIEASQTPGKSYFDLVFVITSIDPMEPIKQRKVKTFDPSYRAVTWPSITALVTAGAIAAPDDIFTDPGQKSKKFLVSYQTPKFLAPARQNDIDWAKTNGRLNDFETNEVGQLLKVFWPVKILRIYTDYDQWAADAQATPQPTAYQPAAPAPVQAAPVADIERGVVLGKLGFFVETCKLDLNQLKRVLSTDPFKKYFTLESKEVKLAFTEKSVAKFGTGTPELTEFFAGLNGYLAPLDSLLINPSLPKSFDVNDPQIRLEVARQIVEKCDHIDTQVAEFLAGLNGYLTMNSPEISSNMEEVPF